MSFCTSVQAVSERSLSGTSGTRNLVTGCDLFNKISMVRSACMLFRISRFICSQKSLC